MEGISGSEEFNVADRMDTGSIIENRESTSITLSNLSEKKRQCADSISESNLPETKRRLVAPNGKVHNVEDLSEREVSKYFRNPEVGQQDLSIQPLGAQMACDDYA